MASEKEAPSVKGSPPEGYQKVVRAAETFKWDQVGKHIEGEYMGMKPGSMGGMLATVRLLRSTELVTFSAPQILEDMLKTVRAFDPETGDAGQAIYIVFNGEVKSAAGRPVKQFDLYVK